MEILTREIIGRAFMGNVTGDTEQVLTLNLARGNAAIINEVNLSVTLRSLVALSANGGVEGTVGVGLDSGLLAVGDLPGIVTGQDDDVGEGRGLLEFMPFAQFISAQIDDTNGNANALAGNAVNGMDVNYRLLAPEDRPMTTEDPELLFQVTQAGGAIGVDVTLLMRYQIVRLTERELGQLSGDVRPTVLRVANTGKPVDIRRLYWGG